MNTISKSRVNVLSIVSLVTGILGLAIVPVVLGHISLSQISRTGERGRVMAVIGLILGYITLCAYAILCLGALFGVGEK